MTETTRKQDTCALTAATIFHFLGILFVYAYPVIIEGSRLSEQPLLSMLPIAAFTIGGGIWAPRLGRAIDRYPVELTLSFGVGLISISFLAYAYVYSVVALSIIAFFVTSAGAQLAGAQGAPKLLNQRYHGNIRSAQMLATLGVSAAALCASLVASLEEISVHTISRSHIFLAITTVLALAAFFLVRRTNNQPSECIQRTQNNLASKATHACSYSNRVGARIYGLGIGGIVGVGGAVILHGGSGAIENGGLNIAISSSTSLSLFAAGGLIGRIVFAHLCRRCTPPTVTYSAALSLSAGTILTFGWIQIVYLQGLGILLIGMSSAAALGLMPILTLSVSSIDRFAETLGRLRFATLFSNVAVLIASSSMLHFRAPATYSFIIISASVLAGISLYLGVLNAKQNNKI